MPVPVYALFAVIAFALIAMLFLSISNAVRNRLIRIALQKFIIPELQKHGLTYSYYKFLKSFSGSGRTTSIVWMNGRPDMTIVLKVFYFEGEKQGSMMAEIKTIALTVQGVTFND
ncbi:hypothetical protein C8P68_101146 [Mucilaginibacter yixingensis]|uniref:Uncharacterized protein n=1 Tax=Mucilaginibacter yixingensis TaxID=1295612 RepID=A0A2T5JEQ7_9SPHI|nr:hypothetical protein [Mucilaginibacter yixingensis]PTR00917.1 hypothetical protein C8P68_101146 [Mucilaginibacter yixingensis]